MNYTALSLQQTPPLSVPLRFMLSAPLFGMLAALLMLYSGPEIFLHRWQPPLLALTHLLTLGFLAMVMFGAMFQLLPVLMGTVLPHPTLVSGMTHALLSLGTLSMVWAWLAEMPDLFQLSGLLLGLGFVLFIGLVGLFLLRSPSRHITRYMMIMALLALTGTLLLGLWMLLGLGGLISSMPHRWVDLHLGWGLGGWVLLLVMGVSYQVIPMFQITREYPHWHKRWIGVGIFIAGLLLGVLQGFYEQAYDYSAYLLWAGLVFIYALVTMQLLKQRRRKLPDVTLRFWWLSMASLLLVTVLLVLPLSSNYHISIISLFIVGFAMSAVNGMLYKIVPFLIWLHLNSRLQQSGRAQSGVPNMRQIIAVHHGHRQFLLHLLSLLFLLASATGSSSTYYPAALLFLLSQLYLFSNLLSAYRLYLRLASPNDT